jgi:hypothetical protein
MRTASSGTQAVLDLCNSIVPGAVPVVVPVQPDVTSKHLDCFHNAARVAQRDGGQVVFGWALFEWPGKLVEAEFHAVVRRRDGTLVDTTPTDDGATSTLFLADAELKYEAGKRVLSRLRAVGRNPDVERYIRAFNDYQAMDAKYFFDNGGDDVGVAVPNAEVPRYEGVQALVGYFKRRLDAPLSAPTVPPATRCPCDSGRRFDLCHGL